MQWVKVTSAAGRPVRVVRMGDWDLLYCVPFTFLVLSWRQAVGLAVKVVSLPPKATQWMAARYNWDRTRWVWLSPVVVGVAGLASHWLGRYSVADAVVALVLLGVLSSTLLTLTALKYSSWNARTLTPREEETQMRWHELGHTLPEGFLTQAKSGRLVLLGCIAAGFWLVCLFGAALVPAGFVRGSLIVVLLLFNLWFDFEIEEHVAAHSPRERVIQNPWKAPHLALLWAVKKYLFFPAYGWYAHFYFTTHTLHHHVENDGPADFQSLDRLSRSSFFGFSQFVFFSGIHRVLSFETAAYFAQRKSWYGLRQLLKGYVLFWPVIACLYWIEPVLALFPLLQMLFSGVDNYIFVARWHALRDVAATSNAEASGGDYAHYFHHKRPNEHLDDWGALERFFKKDTLGSEQLMFRPGVIEDFWRIQGLMWVRDFEALAQCLVRRKDIVAHHKSVRDFYMRRDVAYPPVAPALVRAAVSGMVFPTASRLDRWDEQISTWVGRWMTRKRVKS